MEIQVAIIAGGLATRLGELTKSQPKSMVLIAGKPFLEHQLEYLKKAGVRNVILCVGHLGQQIEDYFGDGSKFDIKIDYSREDRLLGTAGALKRAEPNLLDVFFTLYGDSYLFLDYKLAMTHFKSKNKLAMMSVYKNRDLYDKSNTAVSDGMVKKYSKQEKTGDMVYIEYGANIFDKKVLKMIPQDKTYGLEDLFPRLIEKNQLAAYEISERFYEIGSKQGIQDFTEFIRGKSRASASVPK
jgi:NDP-sugar pyrophosphorylase family protein